MIWIAYISAIIILLYALYILVLLRPRIKRSIPSKDLFTEYAHRGLHDSRLPENSLAAFSAAVEKGYGIELDVQLSADGEVMVFHDYKLERMTGHSGKLSDLTGEELRTLRLNGTDQKIPYLSEVLDLVNGRIPLLIELKGESLDTKLCPKVNDLLQSYSGLYCIESFNPMLLHWYKKNRSDVMRGILTTSACRDRGFSVLNFLLDTMSLNILARPDFIAYDHRYNKLCVKICAKLFGSPMFTWTIRDRNSYDLLAKNASCIFEGFDPKE